MSCQFTQADQELCFSLPRQYDPRHEQICFLHMPKIKVQITFGVTMQLISDFVFAMYKVENTNDFFASYMCKAVKMLMYIDITIP